MSFYDSIAYSMLNLPNILSLLRFPLALLFIPNHFELRAAVLFFAMISDALDGFIARRYQLITKLGTLLDPVMDKFFAGTILIVFWTEQKLTLAEALSFLSRDAAVLLYGMLLTLQGRLKDYHVQAIWCGKITTALQFFVFFGLLFNIAIPSYLYASFLLLGICSFFELYIRDVRT